MSEQNQLSVATESHDKAMILRPEGRIDGSNASTLDSAIQEQFEGGNAVLVFDFSNLNYISSAGLRILLVAARDAQSKGGKSVFCGLSTQIAEIFSVSGFDKILTIHPGLPEALDAV
ncbi:MAG: STAS domain-containing protein [Gammaproteobacteria bacterium]|nr:STAS domain-containing protein [Gammaproteobacteria bacterium]